MEDWGVLFVSMELFSFHKPRKKIRSHIADLALIVGIGGLGIIISNYNKHQQQIRLFSNKLNPHDGRRFTNTYQADIPRGDMDGMNRRVFYAESEFKAVSRVGNAVLRALSPDYATVSRCIHLVASFSPTLSLMLGRPTLNTSLRQEYRKEILTISLPLPKQDTVEVEVHLGEHSIDVTWKTLESSPVDDWLSKLTISLPFQFF